MGLTLDTVSGGGRIETLCPMAQQHNNKQNKTKREKEQGNLQRAITLPYPPPQQILYNLNLIDPRSITPAPSTRRSPDLPSRRC